MGACGECARNLPKRKWIDISAKHWQLIFTSSIQTQDSHIYIKPQQSFTYTSNHKHHIYIKPQASHIHQTTSSHTHIHQTTSFIYTYTSNHKLFLHKRRKNGRNG